MNELFKELFSLRERAKEGRDPTVPDDTLSYLLKIVRERNPKHILEIGAAEGLTSIYMLLEAPEATLTAIELDAGRAKSARENFRHFGVEGRATLHEGDAGDILPLLEGEYDLIFLDGPKVQYRRYLPDCKRLLKKGGVLLSDDVLLFGWVDGSVPVPKKRKMLVEHIREYLRLLQDDPELETTVLKIGEGLAVSEKR